MRVGHGLDTPFFFFLSSVYCPEGPDTSPWHDGPSRRELYPRVGGRGEAFMVARVGDVGYECPKLLFRNTMVATLLGGRRDFARLDSGTASESSGMRLP